VIKFQKGIVTFIESHPTELSQQKFLSKNHVWIFYLKQLHEVLEKLLMHCVSNFWPNWSILIDFFKTKYFLNLEFVEAIVGVLTFDSGLFVVFDFMVVVFDDLVFVPVVVVEIPYSMAERTIFGLFDAESSEVEPTEWLFFLDLSLFH